MSARKPSPPAKPGTPLNANLPKWAQPSAQAHELWGRLTNTKPRAAALLHHLVAHMGTNMGSQNALVCSQKTLARLMGCSVDTIQRATAVLVGEGWIQTVRLNGPGTVLAYLINSAVSWDEQQGGSRLASFKAQVVADAEDQSPETLKCKDLPRIAGLSSLEPVLPSFKADPPVLQAGDEAQGKQSKPGYFTMTARVEKVPTEPVTITTRVEKVPTEPLTITLPTPKKE